MFLLCFIDLAVEQRSKIKIFCVKIGCYPRQTKYNTYLLSSIIE
ncbi:hypothetical protein KL86DYS1_11848 [uncultured Dysgonomonas sp.]|uniref:Uncharacterized protein n=1 Tax=uncultured Dysgonomonas sp. TaxID=206096 RepID=A0A212JCM9_9BACT|nr:hypothetical protein KL86DYS1_11848 [uncultured Dysgonomonas sp.]